MYGVIVVIVILACLVVLVRTGSDVTAATAAVVTVALAGIDMTRRLLHAAPDTDTGPRG